MRGEAIAVDREVRRCEMLAVVLSHAPMGIDGEVVSVEVDLRRGIPGIDLVGLPDNAVRESRERVRVAIRNSGLIFPSDRIVVNLAPAGIRKVGPSFDLPIALGILGAAGRIPLGNGKKLMVLGELNLSGRVRPVNGVLSAVGTGLNRGIDHFFVPEENEIEARSLKGGTVWGISSLGEAVERFIEFQRGITPEMSAVPLSDDERPPEEIYGDIADLRGHWKLKRALEVSAAGRHSLFLFGPPGSGKTMAVRRLPTLMPQLDREESLVVTRIHSIAGLLPPNSGLIRKRPFRMPHHSASSEGVIGGGKWAKPGEVSLAHEGILFLDEAVEFRQNLLQSLREPIEQRKVTIVRVERSIEYPASFQLVMAANSCPCGNLGRKEAPCVCSPQEVRRYWRKIGGALLDRVDIRLPVKPVSIRAMSGKPGDSSRKVRGRVAEAVERQRHRYRDRQFRWNSQIPAGEVMSFCHLDGECSRLLAELVKDLSLSSRAFHSVYRIARTVADLYVSDRISPDHVLEAVQLRRYGEEDHYWSCR